MPKKKVLKKSAVKVSSLTGHDDLPASVGLVKEVRAELKSDIKSLEHKMESKFEQVIAIVHRTQTLMEEQRSENRIVLDGIKALSERHERVDGRLDGFELTLQVLAKVKET